MRGLDRIGFSRPHWWFKIIYKIIRSLTLTQRNNSGPSLRLSTIISFGIQGTLLNLFRPSRQIIIPNLLRHPITILDANLP